MQTVGDEHLSQPASHGRHTLSVVKKYLSSHYTQVYGVSQTLHPTLHVMALSSMIITPFSNTLQI